MSGNKASQKNLNFEDEFFKSAEKYKSGGDDLNLQLYTITCKCQTKENFNPEKKCMCTCSV